ncbi:hypothetical protein QUF74_08025 [Candidatus Halobeggiatoa sp. HSG11]|nr:hypothetical protein [Candidatus Halobeggiatoa sp. HSG11]
MSNFIVPVHLELYFSKIFTLILIILHNGTFLLLLFLILPFFIKIFISLLIIISALYTTRKHLLYINHPLYGCILYYDERLNCIKVQLKSGKEVNIVHNNYNYPHLVILKIDGYFDRLIIFKDSLDIETFRYLRVYLRHTKNLY